jgi:hypothetical protein
VDQEIITKLDRLMNRLERAVDHLEKMAGKPNDVSAPALFSRFQRKSPSSRNPV